MVFGGDGGGGCGGEQTSRVHLKLISSMGSQRQYNNNSSSCASLSIDDDEDDEAREYDIPLLIYNKNRQKIDIFERWGKEKT